MATESKTIQITTTNWQNEVLASKIPVLTDFWAPWCGPCRAIAPMIDELSQEFHGRIKIAKVNVDENPQLAGQLGIRSVPTLLIFKNGRVCEQAGAGLTKATLKSKLEAYLE